MVTSFFFSHCWDHGGSRSLLLRKDWNDGFAAYLDKFVVHYLSLESHGKRIFLPSLTMEGLGGYHLD